MAQQPVIIIGMHRSGTTLITNVLEKLGLFMGFRQNTMQEAHFFFDINLWLLEHTGGSWITPETIDTLYARQDAYDQVLEYVRFLATTPRILHYMGWANYLRYRSPTNFDTAWGWKDPRTTYTLPLWLQIFPNARVIHIHRNGVDVAQSIYTRSQLVINQHFSRWQRGRKRWLHTFLPSYFPRHNPYFLSLEQSFQLWENYVLRAEQHIASLPPERTRTICYETFLKNPLPILEDLSAFISLRTSPDELKAAATAIDLSRGYAYQRDPELVQFYETVKHSPQMMKYGYA